MPQGNSLIAVSFTDENIGTAVGAFGTILRMTDGGQSWISQSSGTNHYLFGVFFTDVNNRTAVGDTILRTTNGGLSFVEVAQIGEVPTEFCFRKITQTRLIQQLQ